MISNVKVYGLEESIVGAKYPMLTSIENLASNMTGLLRWRTIDATF